MQLAHSELLSEMQLAHSLSSLISLCQSLFGIATSQSTHRQRTISFATSCSSNTKTLVGSPQICDQIEVMTPILLNKLIVDNRLSFDL